MSSTYPRPLFRIVLDTNVLLRGLVAEGSAAARILAAAEQRLFIPLLSRPVISEYRNVLIDPELRERFASLSDRRIEVTISRLRFVGDYLRTVRVRFSGLRDPGDEKFIELAINGNATHLLSSDDDLLSLATSHTDAAKRFRQRLSQVEVLDPGEFLSRYWRDL